MTAPNIVNITSMLGKTDTTSLTTTSATSVLENAVGSDKVLRVTLVRAVTLMEVTLRMHYCCTTRKIT